MIYVTHDQVEAMTLADRIVVLNAGHIEQVGTPLELYNSPDNLFVAEFIGSPKMNILDVTTTSGKVMLDGTKLATAPKDKEAVKFGIRPEHLEVTTKAKAKLTATIRHSEHLGEYALGYCTIGDAEITVKIEDQVTLTPGDMIYLSFDESRSHLFDSDGQKI